MTLPLFDAEPVRTPKHHGVQRTSVLAYQAVDSGSRIRDAVALLTLWADIMPIELRTPTSAELYGLAKYREEAWAPVCNDTRGLLHLRSGLSDAKRMGLIENAGKRRCTESCKLALTWRIASR